MELRDRAHDSFSVRRYQVFTAVIRQRDFAEFPDVEKVQGRTVEVDGKVELFKGRPQILLTKKSQLRAVAR